MVPLTIDLVFKKSEGIFTDQMKLADTIPLHTDKDKDKTNNYKPISLLLTITKI